MPLYPLFLDLAGRRCLVVGAGAVSWRKTIGLLDAHAAVVVVSPDEPWVPGVEWIQAEYEPAHLDGVALVIAAAPPDVNARIVADAKARGIWVNSASDPENGDFILPAVRRAGRIEIAVGTQGAAPALAARIADEMRAQVDVAWLVLVDYLAGLRDDVKRRVPPDVRRDLLRRLSDPAWADRIREIGAPETYREMQALVDAAAGP
jgi:precorrin-2 dehydrogenase / sirohydrochlorin ferrochelatase